MKDLKKTIMDKGNYLIVSKILIKNLESLEAAILLAYLVEQNDFYNGKTFFKSHNDIKKDTYLQRHSYEQAKTLLVEKGLIKTWVEKRISYFSIDNECYLNIDKMLNIIDVEISKPTSNTYVENDIPYVEISKPYVENSKPICRNQQTGLLKSAANNNLNNNIKENNNNLLNNDFLVEEDEEELLLKDIFHYYKIDGYLDLELKEEYKILFNKLKRKKYYHIDKYKIQEYNII